MVRVPPSASMYKMENIIKRVLRGNGQETALVVHFVGQLGGGGGEMSWGQWVG